MQNLLIAMLAITGFVLFVRFVAVPLFKGIGAGIGMVFRAIGWFFTHIFEYIGGTLSDIVRFIGALLAMVVLIPLVPLNIVIGRWSAAGHFADGVKRECQVGSLCVYRAVIQRPLKLVLLHGLLEGLEQRVPEAMHGAPGSDKPSRRTGQFDGYTILGSLRAGGSGAKLYIAHPTEEKRRAFKGRGLPDRVVIKSFALTEGSSLPQIVRESRALECAKQLGHVLDHGMDEHRFYYVMPYHPGDHLGILTRQMHGECSGRGLDQKRLDLVMSYTHDLLTTLSAYHKGGLWHKDVKPENVIVHDGEAHLVDLGLVTPLRSAMTLTTHGTEYFRDPEMVRQALRGVKVHQVDGAKFDIYAAGAVLYFMIENTFPAHGGLSRFATQSPEALRWIIRRAMTEYHQRYSTVDEMLADLRFVEASSDAFAVRPADLPSMRGGPIDESLDAADDAAVIAAAGASVPPKKNDEAGFKGFGIAAGVGTRGSFAQIGQLNLDAEGNPIPTSGSASRSGPRLTVTNWWTGEYRAEQPGEPSIQGSNEATSARDFRQHAYALRDQAQTISQQARAGVISARRAAREQIKAARARAREIRNRAAAHRHKTIGRSRTSASTILIGALSTLFLFSVLAMSFFASSSKPSRFVNANASMRADGPSVVLAIDSSAPLSEGAIREIKRLASQYRSQGYNVLEGESLASADILDAIREWQSSRTAQSDREIEDFLEAQNAYGVLHVTVDKPKRGSRPVVRNTFVRSTRPGATERRASDIDQIAPAPPTSLPYLLINDHPTKADVNIAAEIERRLKAYRDRGWLIQGNDDLEVKVRNVLPVGPIDPKATLSPSLFGALAEANFGGILRIDGKAGSEAPRHRVTITRIDGEACEAAAEAEEPVAPRQPNMVEMKPLGAAETATAHSG